LVPHEADFRRVRLARSTPSVVIVSYKGRAEEMGFKELDGQGEDWTDGKIEPEAIEEEARRQALEDEAPMLVEV
jgi:hypothetical protein